MKKTAMMVLALGSALVLSAATLEEANKNISKAIADPAVMTGTMASLKAADQVKFVAAVNKAISKMDGSVEQRTAVYITVSEAALKAAAKADNLLPVLAEIFATVPLSSLGMLSERLADTMFNRALNSAKTFTDGQMLEGSKKVMAAIHERTKSVDASESRDAFAIAMLTRASNGTPKSLSADLVTIVSVDATRPRMTDLAMAAIAGNYEEVVSVTGEDAQLPNPIQVLRLREPQLLDAMEGDLGNSLVSDGYMTVPLTEQLLELDSDTVTEIDKSDDTKPVSDGPAPFNPDGYPGQTM